jgi:hypothetical protein
MPINSRLDDPQVWRERAEEARTLAEHMHSAEARAEMLLVAEGYERMARRAEKRQQSGKTP